ncbi:hypothetical protein pdam_00026000, partial [Pocillopora damicornis]
KVVSYRLFSSTRAVFSSHFASVGKILEEQDSLLFKSHALFSNQDEVPDISNMEAEEALEFAKARAKKPVPRPTSRSSMEISTGEGRSTREV